ncbi:unnamed protein product [Haemonchus placei]|uniref:EGF-like domain-containing protein n=1 Tax=Haemonchus placei TaxID=6290 RepID=A0A0N4WCC4_HAEPC|nr:unnamed protein product [Haemonchus placei]
MARKVISRQPRLLGSFFSSFHAYHLCRALPKMAYHRCGPHYSGAACDWPICVHGVVDPASRLCQCYNHFAPPFCEFCLPGYWAEACDREILPAMPEPLLPPFFGHVVVYLVVVTNASYRCRSKPPPYEEVIQEAPPPPYYLI